MHRILYISTARAPLSAQELDAILAASRRNNAAIDVTGLLVAGGRRFLQVLEGPLEAVTATYDRIAADPRHFALVKLNDKEVSERSFGNWSMGFEAGAETSASGTLEEQVAALVSTIQDANLRAYFTGFAKSHTQG
jgi:hypothetical protein